MSADAQSMEMARKKLRQREQLLERQVEALRREIADLKAVETEDRGVGKW